MKTINSFNRLKTVVKNSQVIEMIHYYKRSYNDLAENEQKAFNKNKSKGN